MTTADIPKHLLPVAGVPSILRLLEDDGPLSSFSQIVIAISFDDSKTLPTLLGEGEEDSRGLATLVRTENADSSASNSHACWHLKSKKIKGQKIQLVKLFEDCFCSIDALRQIEETKLIHPATRIVVFPGDLAFLKKQSINLDAMIRTTPDVACTALLVDVLVQDENGNTLEEPAKVSLFYFSFLLQATVG
jgi:hypothetical protein